MSYDYDDPEPDPESTRTTRTRISVVGVTFLNDEDQVSRQYLLRGVYDETDDDDQLEVDLVTEPRNPYDRHAVSVWIRRPAKWAGRVGFLPRGKNVAVFDSLEAGELDPTVSVKLWCAKAGGVGMVVLIGEDEDAEWELEASAHPDLEEEDDLADMLAEYGD